MTSQLVAGLAGGPAEVFITDPNGAKLRASAMVLVTAAGDLVDLSALSGSVDGLEALVGTTNTTLSTIGTYVDTLEALIASTNGYVDGLEGLLGAGGVFGSTSGAAVVTDAAGTIQQYLRGAIVLALLQNTSLATIAANTSDLDANAEYEAVGASATNQVLGGAGAVGDYLSHVTVFPTSISPGEVTIKDNATTIASFPGGVSSLSNVEPFTIVLGGKSTSGAWKITTGANVSCVAFGNFT